MKKAFSSNLSKVRRIRKLTQTAAAELLGVKRPRYAKYEEGLSEPDMETLISIAENFEISNLSAFISNPNFDYHNQDKQTIAIPPKPPQSNFARFPGSR